MKNIGKNAPNRRLTGQSTQTVKLRKKTPRARKRGRISDGGLEDSMYMEVDEIQRLFSVIKSKRDLALFRIAYHRGLRAHEIGLLKLSDWQNDRLYVHRGKGSRSAEHLITPKEKHALNMWVRVRGHERGPLFPSRNHQPITRSRLDQLIKHYCELAKIPSAKAHMHALKHACGTHLAEMGESAENIKEYLGHRAISSTQCYLHFSKHRRQAMLDRKSVV